MLQHVDTDACRAYLHDFAQMSPTVYLLTRAGTDFGDNLLQLVAEAELFEPGECVVVEHDSQAHQLRVVRPATFDQACHSSGTEHYEMLLRTRDGASRVRREQGS